MWHIILYTVGTLFALRSLASLLANHNISSGKSLPRLPQERSPRSPNPDRAEQGTSSTVAAKPTAA